MLVLSGNCRARHSHYPKANLLNLRSLNDSFLELIRIPSPCTPSSVPWLLHRSPTRPLCPVTAVVRRFPVFPALAELTPGLGFCCSSCPCLNRGLERREVFFCEHCLGLPPSWLVCTPLLLLRPCPSMAWTCLLLLAVTPQQTGPFRGAAEGREPRCSLPRGPRASTELGKCVLLNLSWWELSQPLSRGWGWAGGVDTPAGWSLSSRSEQRDFAVGKGRGEESGGAPPGGRTRNGKGGEGDGERATKT